MNRLRQHRLWLVVILGLSTIFSLAGDLTLYATLPVNAGNLLLTLGQIGVILSANRFIRLISNPITGFLLDRGHRRPVYLVGLLLGTGSTLIYALTHQFSVLLLGRLVWGFAWSFINITGKTMVIDITDRSNRGRYLGILNLMVSLGLSLNPLLGGFLADAVGFRPTMLLSALLTGIGLLLALFLLPESRNAAVRKSVESEVPTHPLPEPVSTSYFYRLTNSVDLSGLGWQTWLVVGLTFITAFAGFGLVMGTAGIFLTQEVQADLHLFNWVLGVTGMTGFLLGFRAILIALTSPIAGSSSDRSQTRWPSTQAGLMLGLVGMLAMGILPVMAAVFVGISLIAIGEGVLMTVLPALIGDHATQDKRGKAVGVAFLAGDLGSAVAPMLAYSLVEMIPLRVMYLASAGAFAVGLLFVWGRRFFR